MSVYIKGMEMPESCSDCPMLEGDRMDGLCHAASRWLDDDEYWTWYVYRDGDVDVSKPCNCPLVSVPEHGRLIDADALIKGHFSDEHRIAMSYADKCWMRRIINEEPTIIPSDKEGEG